MAKQRRSFSAEFKLEAASLVFVQGYSFSETSRSLNIGETVLRRLNVTAQRHHPMH